MAKNNCEILSALAFFAFLTPKMTSKIKFDLILPTQFGGALAFWFLEVFHRATLSASNLPINFFDIFEFTFSFGTLWNYQNIIKSCRRLFEQNLFLFHVAKSFAIEKWELLGPQKIHLNLTVAFPHGEWWEMTKELFRCIDCIKY